uniref:Uncharacterized protein n=1 Tax=Anopheles atroparvus TaxID=41427 RepID=A0AAG5DTL4_ANOAO
RATWRFRVTPTNCYAAGETGTLRHIPSACFPSLNLLQTWGNLNIFKKSSRENTQNLTQTYPQTVKRRKKEGGNIKHATNVMRGVDNSENIKRAQQHPRNPVGNSSPLPSASTASRVQHSRGAITMRFTGSS